MAIPLLDSLDLKDSDITADALLTQRKLAHYLVLDRLAHYHFIVKANQATLLDDLVVFFKDRKQPDFVRLDPPDHGCIETRQIWTTPALNSYLDFPHVGQAFLIERLTLNKKPGKVSRDLAYGITSRSPRQVDPKRLLDINRGPLDHRKQLPLHPRLELRRRPLLDSHGTRPRECHPLTPLRYRSD